MENHIQRMIQRLLLASLCLSLVRPLRRGIVFIARRVKNNLADCKKVYLDLYWSPIGLPYSKAYFYLEEDVNTLTETIVFANDPDPFLENTVRIA